MGSAEKISIKENYDIDVLSSSAETISHCLSIVQNAKNVKNTILLYGMESRPTIFSDWIKAKEVSLKEGCAWAEIVTKHMDPDDIQMKFMESVKDKGYGYRKKFR